MGNNKHSVVVLVFLALVFGYSSCFLSANKAMAATSSTSTTATKSTTSSGIEIMPGQKEPAYNILDDLGVGERTSKTDEDYVCKELGLANGTRALFSKPIEWISCGVTKFFYNKILKPFYEFACKFQASSIGQAYGITIDVYYDRTSQQCIVK